MQLSQLRSLLAVHDSSRPRAAVTPPRAVTPGPSRRLAAMRSAAWGLQLSTAARCVAAVNSAAEATEAETELQKKPEVLPGIFEPQHLPLLELLEHASTTVREAAKSAEDSTGQHLKAAEERKAIAAAAAVLQELGGSSDTLELRKLLGKRGSLPPGRLLTLLRRFPEHFLISKTARKGCPYDVRLVAQTQHTPEPSEQQPGSVGCVTSQQQNAEPPSVKIPEPVRTPPPPPPRGTLRYAVLERAKWSPTVGRSAAQRNYHAALFSGLASYVITVSLAGTGKTHLAVQAGAAALLSGAAHRLIITRPAVTVGEDLGYLPGSIDKKMEPYMVPILDLLADVWSSDELEELQDERKLQIVPLGFMRGRTFGDAFIVADEMQNCSKAQMRTLLTRLGQNSRMVVTGDLNQADASNNSNGLRYLVTKLRAQLHGEAVAADASDEVAIAGHDAGSGESEQLPLRDAVHRDFELVTLDNSSMQRNAAVQTVLRLLV